MSVKTSSSQNAVEAFDPAASVFVSANAGAGKTSLLANRVLSLLLHGVEPAKILCLTFTNAAAAEMANRVQKELGRWVMADDATLSGWLKGLLGREPEKAQMSRARALFAKVLEAPEGVRIQTLHGFCQSLLRRFPLEAGVSPHFTVMDGRTSDALLLEARQRLFTRAQEQDSRLKESLSAMARLLGESQFQSLLRELAANIRKLRVLFAAQDGVTRAVERVWKQAGLSAGMDEKQLIEAHLPYDEETLTRLRRICAELLKQEAKSNQDTGRGLAQWLETRRDTDAYMNTFITDKGTSRTRLFIKGSLNESDGELLRLEQERVMRFSQLKRSLAVAQNTTHMLHVGEALLSLYDAQKRSRALMDYDDLILGSTRLLDAPDMAPWVLYKLDGGIDHILVDEAQDTSPEQWHIIDKMTEEFFSGQGARATERSLFVVGDEKQSIYSFQGADPTALGRKREHFSRRIEAAALRVHRIELTHSYRSAREVLLAVDAVFAQPHARSGLTFSDGRLEHIPTRLTHPGFVEIWPLTEGSEYASASTQLARQIADTIRHWLDSKLWLEARQRPVEVGDIMIMVRSRTPFVDRLVRALKRRNVAVAGRDRMELSDNLAVQDLVALGQVLLLPEDDLTMASVLRSPIFGLSDAELFALCSRPQDQRLWQSLGEHTGKVYANAYALLSDLRARADFTAPYELYSTLLDTLGARRRFLGRMGEEYNDAIEEFLGQALLYERSHTPSLQGFLHWLSAGGSTIKRDMEQAQNCVRIMTVHGAKGLQAPIVILPDTISLPRMLDTILWHEEEVTLPVWPVSSKRDDAWCENLRGRRKDADLAEHRRLLYVALTRAEDRLYICGAAGRGDDNPLNWYRLVTSGLSSLAEAFDMNGKPGWRLGTPPAAGASGLVTAGAAVPAELSFSFLTRQAPADPLPPKPLVPSRLSGEEPAAASPLKASEVYARGQLIHRLLQHLPDAPNAETAIAAAFARQLSTDDIAACISEAKQVIAHPDCAALFAPGSLAEAPIAGNVVMEGKTVSVSGQIDRLMIGEKDVWIGDFKSNRTPPAAGKRPPAAYVRQLRLYQLLLRQIYPDKTVRCLLIWTAAPRVDALPDALLDELPATTYI